MASVVSEMSAAVLSAVSTVSEAFVVSVLFLPYLLCQRNSLSSLRYPRCQAISGVVRQSEAWGALRRLVF